MFDIAAWVASSVSAVSLEDKIKHIGEIAVSQPQVECPVKHLFNDGVYIREVTIPANTFSIGHYHKYSHVNVMLKGRVKLITENGITELVAPCTFISSPGRKVGYVVEEMVWLNIYHTNEKDVDVLEKQLFDFDASPWYNEKAYSTLALEDKLYIDECRHDFKDVCSLLGFTEEQVWEMSSNEDDLIDFPNGEYGVVIKDSPIHGKGMFATNKYVAGETIAPARLNGMRTPAGRWVNHSVIPNAKMVMDSWGNVNLVALTAISGNSGGLLGDEITVDYYDAFIDSRS